MDVEVNDVVEMRKCGDEVAPAADLDTNRILRRMLRRQNGCFAVAMTSFLIATVVFIVVRVYVPGEEMEFADELYQPTQGEVGNTNSSKIAEAMKHFKGHHHNGAIEEWLKGRGKVPEVDPSIPHPGGFPNGHPMPGGGWGYHSGVSNQKQQDVEEWLQHKVTLDDGAKYEVVERLQHDPTAFTEGLTYGNGLLYESTGINGRSTIRSLDPSTGEVIESVPIEKKYFGEGLTYVDGKLIQLTYKRNMGFIYDAENLSEKPSEFTFSTTTKEGWGMTYDPNRKEIIVSDGSDFLLFWDPTNFTEIRKLEIFRQNSDRAKNINELEYWRGRIIANIWFEDTIVVINPETGEIEKEYDFSTLWPKRSRRSEGADVLNGISVSDDPDMLYVTGKDWDRMFKIKLLY